MAVKTNTSRERQLDFMRLSSETLALGGGIATGVIIGNFIIKKATSSGAVNGLMGTDTVAYIVPAGMSLASIAYRYKLGKETAGNKLLGSILLGMSGSGMISVAEKLTKKDLLSGLEGLLGLGDPGGQETLPQHHVEIPAADIDIEEAIRQAAAYNPVSGAQDFSMSDEPVSGAQDFSMSDEPISGAQDFSMSDEPMGAVPVYGEADIFAGDMMDD